MFTFLIEEETEQVYELCHKAAGVFCYDHKICKDIFNL